jgi:hypothetical protein
MNVIIPLKQTIPKIFLLFRCIPKIQTSCSSGQFPSPVKIRIRFFFRFSGFGKSWVNLPDMDERGPEQIHPHPEVPGACMVPPPLLI